MEVKFLDLKYHNEAIEDALVDAATRVVRSGWYLLGGELASFEEEFSDWVGCDHTIGVSSGLAALRLVLEAWVVEGKLELGDRVGVPSNTYIASVLAISAAGLKPVLLEPNEGTFNLCESCLDTPEASDLKALLVVHLYGRIVPMDKLMPICRERGILVLEDVAQAHGTFVGGRMAGSWGDAAGFSFYPGKNMGALGDAGAVCCSSEETAKVVRALRNYGSHKKYENLYRGGNDRMDEIQAAMLKVKLKHIGDMTVARRSVARRYMEGINHSAVKLPGLPASCSEHAWHLFVVRVGLGQREDFVEHLKENGVGTLIHYPIPPHRQVAYAGLFEGVSLPIAEAMAEDVVSLPISPVLTSEEVEHVINAVNTWER